MNATDRGHEHGRVVLVEHSPLLARLVVEQLRDTFTVDVAGSLADLRARPVLDGADCAVVDLGLPDAADLQALEAVRDLAPDVPVVVLAARPDERLERDALASGAQDFLARDAAPSMLVRAIRHAISRKQFQGELSHQALHDPLTGLANRSLLEERLSHALARAERSGSILGVCFVDLDGFKPVNDLHGHAAGDLVLVEVARRLTAAIRPGDTVARIGGDEFVVVCEELRDPAEIDAVADRLLAAFDDPFSVDGAAGPATVDVGASVGTATTATAGPSVAALVEAADDGCYEAKARGGGRAARRSAPGDAAAARRRSFAALGAALALDRFDELLGDATDSAPAILASAARALGETVDGAATVWLFDGKALSPRAWWHGAPTVRALLDAALRTLPPVPPSELSARVLATNTPVAFSGRDVDALPAATASRLRGVVDAAALSSMLVAPLRARGRAIGLLVAARREPFAPTHRRTLARFARRVALALDDADRLGREPADRSSGGSVPFAALFRSLGDPVVFTDIDNRIRLWNPAAEAVYGWAAAEVLGRPVSDVLHTRFGEGAPTRDEIYESVLRAGTWRGRVRQQHRDGTTLLIDAVSALVRDDAGRVVGMASINRPAGCCAAPGTTCGAAPGQ